MKVRMPEKFSDKIISRKPDGKYSETWPFLHAISAIKIDPTICDDMYIKRPFSIPSIRMIPHIVPAITDMNTRFIWI
jgi:hypothetical protein